MLLVVLLLGGALTARAQQAPPTVFNGSVRLRESGEAVAGANVILQTADGKSVLGFSSTDANGAYSIQFRGRKDTVMLKVTGFNVKPAVRVVSFKSQTVNFSVAYEKMTIREVLVKSESVKRRGDTLNYYVASYIDSLDRNIGDVLKKMPGIDVKSNGQILYNSKPINKFYVEGLDMMGGSYGQAVNNVRAKDIASVQVLENHQPIKALKEISFSDKAAINLKLKDKAKGTFASTMVLGAGIKPWMWYASVAAMQFSAGFQFLATYKTNNSGEDVTSELNSFYGGLAEISPMAAVHKPSVPGIDKGRYMDNATHALSANVLLKLDSIRTVTVQGKYIHDLEKFASNSRTVYYIAEAEPLEIAENTFAAELGDGFEAGIHYNANARKRYTDENFTARADIDSRYGYVKTGADSIAQQYAGTPKVRLKNHFRAEKVVAGRRLSFSSDIDYGQLPEELRVTPVVFPQIFGAEKIDVGSIVQSADDRKFNATNSIKFGWQINRLHIGSGVGLNADVERLRSNICRADAGGALLVSPDSLTNDILWRRFDAQVPLYISYFGGGCDISFTAVADYMNLNMKDAVRGSGETMNRVFVTPSLMVSGRLTPDLKYHIFAFMGHDVGGSATNIYSGYVMSDYRVVSSYDGKVPESRSANVSTGIDYGDALISMFGSLEATYYRNRTNLMYGYEYVGSLARIESYSMDNLTQGYSFSGKIEKRFDDIATTVGVPVSYTRSYMSVLRQGKVMPTAFWILPLGLNVSTVMLKRKLRIDYDLTCSCSQSILYGVDVVPGSVAFGSATSGCVASESTASGSVAAGNATSGSGTEALEPIDALSQKLDISYMPSKSLSFRVTGEHYYNGSISIGSRSMFFLDAGITYKNPTVEYILSGRNLLNTTSFNQALYTDATAYSYAYKLRPLSLMLKVRFSIR